MNPLILFHALVSLLLIAALAGGPPLPLILLGTVALLLNLVALCHFINPRHDHN